MLCTVSTVKDTRHNVEQFVERNLSSGADHMLVFLEGDEDGTHAFLQQHPHVTPVLTTTDYWGSWRPAELIDRQMANANVVNCLVSVLGTFDWLAHIDGDECLDIDVSALTLLAPDVRCVRLGVLEAVSTEEGGRGEERFKRRLKQPQLERLVRAGVIEEPTNISYFRAYTHGKAMTRPGLDVDIGIHRVQWRGGEALEHHKSPGFRVLHYASVSFEEFVRKWSAHVEGGATQVRDHRIRLKEAVARLIDDAGLDEADRRERLLTLYRQHVEDPVDVLERRGLLVQPPPDRHRHRPTLLTAAQLEDVQALMRALLPVDKRTFAVGGPPSLWPPMLREMSTRLGDRPHLVASIEKAIDRVEAAGLP